MRKLLLSISLLGLYYTVAAQQPVNAAGPQAKMHAVKGGKGAKAKSSRKGMHASHKGKEKEIVHTAPDQRREDSIKNEKMRHKK